MEVILSTLRAGRALSPRKIFWYSFLLEAKSTPGLEGLGEEKVTFSWLESPTDLGVLGSHSSILSEVIYE
jgi:hypothetical protein